MIGALLVGVLGCSDDRGMDVSARVVERSVPAPAPVPVRRTRSLRLEASWGGDPVSCEPPCAVVPVGRAEATSAREGHGPALAVDGDPATAWCGIRGRRDQLMIRFDPPSRVDSMVVHAAGIGRLALTTDRWDEASVALGPFAEGASPPHVALGLDEVTFVNLEIAGLHEGGAGCIEEIAFTSGG